MTKKLVLTRHAKARERDHVTEDLNRPIRAKGIHQAQSIGLQLKHLSLVPDCIVSSPSLRTKETAVYIKSMLSCNTDITIEERLYDCYYDDIVESVKLLSENHTCVLFTLHNPAITELTYQLDRSNEKITHLRCGESVIIEINNRWDSFSVHDDYKLTILKP